MDCHGSEQEESLALYAAHEVDVITLVLILIDACLN